MFFCSKWAMFLDLVVMFLHTTTGFFLDLTVLAYHICKKILDIKHLGKPWDWKRARVGGKSRPCAKVIKPMTYIKGHPKCCLH